MSYESLEEARKYHIQNKTHWIGESLGEYKHQIWDMVYRNKYKNILDYGAGKAAFHKLLFNNTKIPGAPVNINIVPYDPAYEPFSTKPTGKFELVLCIDVMEHVQEDKIDEVLADIFSFGDNRPEKGEPIINKEEWNPSAETLEKLKKNDKTLDDGQKEKAKLLR